MNDLQIFSNPEFGQVRTVELDGRIDQLKSVAFGLPASPSSSRSTSSSSSAAQTHRARLLPCSSSSRPWAWASFAAKS